MRRLVKGVCGTICDMFLYHKRHTEKNYVALKFPNTPLDFIHTYGF
jgi:hypothetical protein